GMTLGFGTTLIGEAVDYAIYYLIQARPDDGDEASGSPGAERWLAASWPTVRLGLFTSLIGFAALVFSGFPGLAQLGVFSIAGLAAAAATTRFVLPRLAPRGAPGRGLRRWLALTMRRGTAALARARPAFAAIAVLAAGSLVVLPSPWRGSLAALSPIGADALRLDATLRTDVGAPDAGTLIAVSAADEAGALQGAEAVGTRLDRLVGAGVLAGYDSPARFLPSTATQAARRAALPDAPTLRTRLAAATADGPLHADRLEPFVAAVEAARTAPLLTRAALRGTSLAGPLDALLLAGHGGKPWRALINVQAAAGAAIDPARLRAATADVAGAHVVAIKPELDALYAGYLRDASWQAALGGAAVLALLAWRLRNARRVVRVALPVAAAATIVIAVLAASGAALGILHLVGILLTVAIGSNYALFFDHLHEHGAADDDTLASLLLANLTTVTAFGLLATSSIPVLQAIGIVVAPGALLGLVLSAALIGTPDRPGEHGRIDTRR
ncbi:MAG: transporter, partial [Caldimonas sp.]